MQTVKKDDSSSDDIPEYQVVKVEKTPAPDGEEGENWCTYIIQRNSNTNIVGLRRGTMEQVREYARCCVEDINQRQGNGGYSMWSTRRNRQLNK